jgi:thioesterase domain-containing protein
MHQQIGNPVLLQKGDPCQAPLFLIHDASGGIFNYYKLENVGRPIFAIQNPWLGHGAKWEGGVMTLVNKYIELIKSVMPKGDILVGGIDSIFHTSYIANLKGWSLGGQIGIEIGRVLTQNKRSRLRVIGNVMIDTLFPYWGPPGTVHAELPVELLLGEFSSEQLKDDFTACSEWSRTDSLEWASRNSTDKAKALEGVEAEDPPPSVLLFASRYVPVTNQQNEAVVFTDYLRHAKSGWEMFPHNFIIATWDLPAHHFGLFEPGVVCTTPYTIKIRS